MDQITGTKLDADHNSAKQQIGLTVQLFFVFLMGLGIGWIAGLSVSPVASTIMTSILGIIGGIIAGGKASTDPHGSDIKSRVKMFDVIPAALLVIGIAIAVPIGILARTYHVFEPESSQISFNTDSSNTAIGIRQAQNAGVLFNSLGNECDELLLPARLQNEQVFRSNLQTTKLPGSMELARKIESFEILKLIVERLCDT